MFTIIRNAHVYGPQYLGLQDVLIAFDRIVQVRPHIDFSFDGETQEIDAGEKLLVPGFIDQHVHIIGGGGEGGPATRTPEILMADIIKGGVTTVVGLLGADGVTRNMRDLLAKAKALESEGISTYIYSGSYHIPPATLTGKVISDLVFIDKVLGVGEIAISDHRSSNPSPEKLIELASEARLGGMLGNKPGIVHLHLGEGKSGFKNLMITLEGSDIPITQFVPTHVNRLASLFKEAVDFSRMGGIIDLTAGIKHENASPSAMEIKEALVICKKEHLDFSRITASSDGNGSLPEFDQKGNLISVEIGSVSQLWEDIRAAVLEEILPLETAVALITSNPARVLKLLPVKGSIAAGSDADLVLLRPDDYSIDSVIARGKLVLSDGHPVNRQIFHEPL